MYEQGLGVGPTDLTSLIPGLVSLFQGKPSDFRVWMYFDQGAHYTRQLGDKPNSQTISMANAVIQAMQQYIAQQNAQGVTFNLPAPFVVNIGSRDPSYFYMPSSAHGDPYHGGGTNAVATLAGPGDPNGTLQGIINFIRKYASGTPQTGTTVQPGAPVSSVPLPSTGITSSGPLAAPVSSSTALSPYSSAGFPSSSYYGYPSAATPIPYGGYVPATQGGMLSSLSGNLPMMLALGGGAILLAAMVGSNQSAPRTRTVYRSRRRASRR